MKLTKFTQSCVLVETKGKRILIDPGSIGYDPSLLEEYWNTIDAIFVTHKHSDHIKSEAILEMTKNPKTKFYTTAEVAHKFPELSPEIIKEGDCTTVGEVTVEAVHAIHGYLPRLKGGNEIYENVGYIIDDGTTRVYHTSDTICFQHEYRCDILFISVNDHGLVMGPYDAAQFANEMKPKISIPIHCDNIQLPGDIPRVKEEFEKLGLNFKEMKVGESIET